MHVLDWPDLFSILAAYILLNSLGCRLTKCFAFITTNFSCFPSLKHVYNN